MCHVFISYARADSDFVAQLRTWLVEHDIDVWVDTAVHHGADWESIIAERLDRSSAVVVVMSEQSASSYWVRNEILRARRRQIPLFPVLLSGEPFFSLEALQFVDVTDGLVPSDRFFEDLKHPDGALATAQRRSSTPNISVQVPADAPTRAAEIERRLSALLPKLRFAGANGREIKVMWKDLSDGSSGGFGSCRIFKVPYVPRFGASVFWVQTVAEAQRPSDQRMAEFGFRPSIVTGARLPSDGQLPFEVYDYSTGGIHELKGTRSGAKTVKRVSALLAGSFDLASSELRVEVSRPKLTGEGFKDPIPG